MGDHIIKGANGKGLTIVSKGKDVEFTNPIDYLKDRTLRAAITRLTANYSLKNPSLTPEEAEYHAREAAYALWGKRYKQIAQTEVPQYLIELLSAERKKDQENLLKQKSITSTALWAFIFKAYSDFGFTFSQYVHERIPRDMKDKRMPRLAILDPKTGKIERNGESNLTDGEVKKAIEFRKVVIAKIIDKGESWHGFYITFDSIAGKETWKEGQTHFHYSSNKFLVSREDVVRKIKTDGDYPMTKVHIPLTDYGNQTGD